MLTECLVLQRFWYGAQCVPPVSSGPRVGVVLNSQNAYSPYLLRLGQVKLGEGLAALLNVGFLHLCQEEGADVA
jgi:hypothetical protein